MTTLAEARDGLEERLRTIAGLRVYDHVPDDLNPPAAVIMPPVVPDYREDLGTGSFRVIFPVLVLVTVTVARQQNQLYEYLDRTGPLSIFAAIEADRTLGGLNVDAVPINVDEFDMSQLGASNYYARAVNIGVLIS